LPDTVNGGRPIRRIQDKIEASIRYRAIRGVMASNKVALPDKLINELSQAFKGVDRQHEIARQRFASANGVVEMLVGNAEGAVNVFINIKEHAPPHVHVKYAQEEARFRIDDGERFPEDKDLTRYKTVIKYWLEENRRDVILTWNRSRPSNCPVGVMDVPLELK
jgi:hypothetical protein